MELTHRHPGEQETESQTAGQEGPARNRTNFACRFAGYFRAIASHSGGGPDEEAMGYQKRPSGCFVCPGGPTATLVTHGNNDDQVDPGSGEFTASCYAETNGCSTSIQLNRCTSASVTV